MSRIYKSRKNRWEEGPCGIPNPEVISGRSQRHRFSEQYQGGRQHRRQQRQSAKRSSFGEEYESKDRKGKSRARFPSRTRHDFTYRHEADKEIPLTKARRDSSSSQSTAGGSPPYSPPPPSSLDPNDLRPCTYCLETRKAQGELIIHVNHLTTAFIQAMMALHTWLANPSAGPSDEMDWQYDATTVMYYREGRLGHIIEER